MTTRGQILVSSTDDDPLLSVCPSKKPPCVDSKRPRVYRHHAHMCYHMCAWYRYTRGRFESTHGGFFCVPSRATHHTTPQHTTPHGDRETQRQRQTETERETEKEDRNRETETEKEDRNRQRQRETERETRQDKKRQDKTRKEKMRQ